jgi:hypothetical protein
MNTNEEIYQSIKHQYSHSPALWVGVYLLLENRKNYPERWWGSKRASTLPVLSHPQVCDLPLQKLPLDWTPRELKLGLRNLTFLELSQRFSFHKTPLAAVRSLELWTMGEYPIVLYHRIPSVLEVLELQKEGKRCVSLFEDFSCPPRTILEKYTPLSFAIHDLVHAHHFFSARDWRAGQCHFYQHLYDWWVKGALDEIQTSSQSKSLEYLMSDMNSHPIHLWKCLRAICDDFHPQYWETLLHKSTLSDFEINSLLKFNRSDLLGLHEEQRAHRDFFQTFCEVL